MKSAQLINGDLALKPNGEVQTVTGRQRLVQELSCWILEPVGTDPAYPNFGSTLTSLVGSAVLSGTTFDIESELLRVLNNYIAYQGAMFEEYINDPNTFMDVYSPDELVASIDTVRVTRYNDAVVVNVAITTVAGTQVSLSRSLAD
jgi:hypothetical protein